MVEVDSDNLVKEAMAIDTLEQKDEVDTVAPDLLDVIDEIVRLRIHERLSYPEIRAAMNDNPAFPETIDRPISRDFISDVCLRVVDPEVQQKITQKTHLAGIQKHAGDIKKAQDESRRKRQLLVWREEWDTYFLHLLKDSYYLRPEDKNTTGLLSKESRVRHRVLHYNHVEIANAMSLRFGTSIFNTERTRRRLEQVRKAEKKTNNPIVVENGSEVIHAWDRDVFERIPDTFPLKPDLQWEIIGASNNGCSLNIHEMRRALATVIPFIEHQSWDALVEQVSRKVGSFTQFGRALMYKILSEGYRQMGQQEMAARVLEFVIREGGDVDGQLNQELHEIAAGEPTPKGRDARARRHVPRTRASRQ